MSNITHVDTQNFDDTIKNAPKPIVMDVFATWCGPCQHMAPTYEELSVELADSYTFTKLNIDESREIAIQLGIMSVPTFLFFNKGELIGQEIGYMNKDQLKEKIIQHLGTPGVSS